MPLVWMGHAGHFGDGLVPGDERAVAVHHEGRIGKEFDDVQELPVAGNNVLVHCFVVGIIGDSNQRQQQKGA